MNTKNTCGALAVALALSLMACKKEEGAKPADTTQPTTAPAQPGAPAQPAAPAQPGAAAPTGDAAAPAGQAAAPTAQAGTPAAEAQQIFKTRCVLCHGADGKGTGQAAAALNPKPRDWTNAEWQKSTTDENIAKVIVEGGPALKLSPLMAANPDLKGKDDVVKELVKIVRGYAAK